MKLRNELQRTIRGRVLTADDDGFDDARLAHNLAVDQKVLAVVEAEDAADVAAVVRAAGLAGLAVAAQPTGHGATGDVDGVVLLRTGRLNQLEVRPDDRLARAGAGVAWREVLAAASPHGLTGLAGSSPVTSVTGYTLGGGLSWFGRRYGLAANSVRSFDVVTADGVQRHVDADTEPDLFWALRGGGGDFAIVTDVEFGLHPAPALYGGRLIWPAEHRSEVLDVFRAVTAHAPDELTVWFDLLQLPDLPQLPDPLRGLSAVAVDVAHLGSAEEAQALIKPFEAIDGCLMDTRRTLPVADLGAISDEPTTPGPSMIRAELLTGFDGTAASTLLDATSASGTVTPLLFVQLRHLGGAFARSDAEAGAAGHIEEEFQLSMLGLPFTPEAASAIGQRMSDVSAAMLPFTSSRRPFNSLASGERAANALPAATLDRLRDIKRRVDPRGVVRSNFPVLG